NRVVANFPDVIEVIARATFEPVSDQFIAWRILPPSALITDQHDSLDVGPKLLVGEGKEKPAVHPLERILTVPFLAGLKCPVRQPPCTHQLGEPAQAGVGMRWQGPSLAGAPLVGHVLLRPAHATRSGGRERLRAGGQTPRPLRYGHGTARRVNDGI